MAKEKLYILLDFDGTVVTHDFPRIGKEIGSVHVIKRLVGEGHMLILFTMRSKFFNKKKNIIEDTLAPAVQWFKDNEIPLYGIQINPTQWGWTSSPKAYGHLIIDDIGLGCPLLFNPAWSPRPFVNWVVVEKMLEEQGVLTTINIQENGNETIA